MRKAMLGRGMLGRGMLGPGMLAMMGAAAMLAGCAGDTAASRSAAGSDADRIARRLAGMTAGAPQSCVPRDMVNETVRSADTILFVQGRKRVYRTTLVGSCPGLARGDVMVSRSFGSSYCRGDIIETHAVPGGFLTGSCSLGDFVPYSR